jgi:hypothetical protein
MGLPIYHLIEPEQIPSVAAPVVHRANGEMGSGGDVREELYETGLYVPIEDVF